MEEIELMLENVAQNLTDFDEKCVLSLSQEVQAAINLVAVKAIHALKSQNQFTFSWER